MVAASIALACAGATAATPFTPTDDAYVLASGREVGRERPALTGRAARQLSSAQLAEELSAYLQLARLEQDQSYVGLGLHLIAALTPAQRAHPELALVHGDLLQYAHQFKPAVEAYTQAARDPRLAPRAELSLFVLQMALGRFEDAAQTCESLHGNALSGYGIVCQSWLLGVVVDSGAAISRLQLLLPLLADNPPLAAWAHEILLDLLWQAGEIDNALELLDTPNLAGSNSGDTPVVQKLPVEIVRMSLDYLILAGRYGDAARLLERAADPRPLFLYREMLQRLSGGIASNPGDVEDIIASYTSIERVDKYALLALWRYKVEADPVSALALAKKSWRHFRYVSDALLLQQLAIAAGDDEVLREIQRWRQHNAIQSALLVRG